MVRKRFGMPKESPLSISKFLLVDEIMQISGPQIFSRSLFRQELSDNFTLSSYVNKNNILQLQITFNKQFRLGNVKQIEVNNERRWDWSNMVTIHDNIKQVLFWIYTDKVLSPLQPDNQLLMHQINVDAKARANQFKMTACGNFVVVSYTNNLIVK
jgi:hypothetical protein